MADVAQSLVKAYLLLIEPTPTGQGAELDRIDFQFNPKEYSFQKSTTWKSKPAKGAKDTSMPEFQGSNPRAITLEMFLDASEASSKPIEPKINQLMACCVPWGETIGKNKPSPPFVVFGWGKSRSVAAYVKQVQVKFTMFSPDGTPTRATCSIQLEEVPSAQPRQNPTSGGLAARRTHQVVAGDTLASIAYAEYGTPTFWRALAEANGLDDPARLVPGTSLLVPPDAEAKALA